MDLLVFFLVPMLIGTIVFKSLVILSDKGLLTNTPGYIQDELKIFFILSFIPGGNMIPALMAFPTIFLILHHEKPFNMKENYYQLFYFLPVATLLLVWFM